MSPPILLALALAAAPPAEAGGAAPAPGGHFKIVVADDRTGRGVPLVELRTTAQVPYWTDSNGIVAFHDPALMGQKVFFHVKSHGYEFPADGFGFRGKALDVTAGGEARLEVRRLNVAERLYRITGEGIYRDSILTGHPVSLRRPLLNALVSGQDSVLSEVFQGKIHWFWGDTNRPAYPLGNFHTPGAVSLLPAAGGLDPEKGIDLEYFTDEHGFAKPTARMPGDGPTWLGGLTVLRAPDGRERLFAGYVKVRGQLEVYRHGLVEWNAGKGEFEQAAEFAEGAPAYPSGHTFHLAAGGVEHVHFADPYPLTRVRADAESLRNLAGYESFTCLEPGSRSEAAEIDRDAAGAVRYAWRAGAAPFSLEAQARLVHAGRLKPEESLLALRDADTGKPVAAHRGSVYFNAHRGRWIMVFTESMGTSALGEVWYAEADAPAGPWVHARKVVTHEEYSFYNPKHHPMLDKEGGRVVFFEGTYVTTFSGNPNPTPRYDYNQVMYRLDLDDPRLVLPVPVYALSDPAAPDRFCTLRDLAGRRPRPRIAFFALDRERPGSVPVFAAPAGGLAADAGGAAGAAPVFHALPAGAKDPPATAAPLYEFAGPDGARAHSTDPAWSRPGWRRADAPVCLVWRNPVPLISFAEE
jgi:hypothetical protein